MDFGFRISPTHGGITIARGRLSQAFRGGVPMPTQKQITVSLENKPGRLAQLLSELARQKVNVVALAVMDRNDQGVLRLVTEDAAATVAAVKALNVQYNSADVLAVELRNQPGALAH